MADSKISALTALAGIADGDLLPIVDVSDTTQASTGTTKKATFAELMARTGIVQELTASGAITGTVVLLNHISDAIAATLAAPVGGERLLIIDTSASGSAAHTVTLPAGVTFCGDPDMYGDAIFSGTLNTATFDSPGEALEIVAISATQWFVVRNMGAVELSTV